jgi:hypothetical protein
MLQHTTATMLYVLIAVAAIGIPVGLVTYSRAWRTLSTRMLRTAPAADEDLQPHPRLQRSKRSL